MPGHGDYRVDNLGRGQPAREIGQTLRENKSSVSWGDIFTGEKTLGIIIGGKKSAPPIPDVPALPETPRLKSPFSGISFRDKKFLRVGDKVHVQRHHDQTSYLAKVVQISTPFIRLSLHLQSVDGGARNIQEEVIIINNNFFDYSLHLCPDYTYLGQAKQLYFQQNSLIRTAFHNAKNRSEKKKQAKRMQLRSSCKQRRTPKQQGKMARLIKESFLEMNF